MSLSLLFSASRTEYVLPRLRPGMTGLAQVSGRDKLSIKNKVEIDRKYLERQSFIFDLYIIWLTALKVLKRDDIAH